MLELLGGPSGSDCYVIPLPDGTQLVIDAGYSDACEITSLHYTHRLANDKGVYDPDFTSSWNGTLWMANPSNAVQASIDAAESAKQATGERIARAVAKAKREGIKAGMDPEEVMQAGTEAASHLQAIIEDDIYLAGIGAGR
jgi:hypothetical protein